MAKEKGLSRPSRPPDDPATRDPLFEAALGFVEGKVGRGVRGAGLAVLRRRMAHHQLVARKTDVDRDMITIPVAMMVARQFDDHMARYDSIGNVVQPFAALAQVLRQRVRLGHGSEGDSKRAFASVWPSRCVMQPSCEPVRPAAGGPERNRSCVPIRSDWYRDSQSAKP